MSIYLIISNLPSVVEDLGQTEVIRIITNIVIVDIKYMLSMFDGDIDDIFSPIGQGVHNA